MNGPVSGDVVLVPSYPDFYFETAPLNGDHGGLSREELTVPFALFRPGAGADDLAHVRRTALASLDLTTKNRPAVTDLKAVVLALLGDPVPRRAADPKPAPPAGSVWVREPAIPGDARPWAFQGPRELRGGAVVCQDSCAAELTSEMATLRDTRFDPSPGASNLALTFTVRWTEPPARVRPGERIEIEVERGGSSAASPHLQRLNLARTFNPVVTCDPPHFLTLVDNPYLAFRHLGPRWKIACRVEPAERQPAPLDRFEIRVMSGDNVLVRFPYRLVPAP